MENKKFLSEERYQKNRKNLVIVAVIVLVLGMLIGGSLIAKGISNSKKVNNTYTEENKQITINNLNEQINTEKTNLETKKAELESKRTNALAVEKKNLETKKTELESKGIKFDAFTKYDDGESYDLKIITKALDPSYNYCLSDEYKNNSLTSKYCSIINNADEDYKILSDINYILDNGSFYCVLDEYKNNSLTSKYCLLVNQLEEAEKLDVDFEKKWNNFDNKPFYMTGAFIIMASCIISGFIYTIAKRREITAFTTQQVIPVSQEGIEKMTPTVGNAAKEIAKGIKDNKDKK